METETSSFIRNIKMLRESKESGKSLPESDDKAQRSFVKNLVRLRAIKENGDKTEVEEKSGKIQEIGRAERIIREQAIEDLQSLQSRIDRALKELKMNKPVQSIGKIVSMMKEFENSPWYQYF